MHEQTINSLREKKTNSKNERNVIKDILLITVIGIIVRIFCIVYTIICSRLINSYKFNLDLLCYGNEGSLWEYIKYFSYWDGEYFLKLSLNETEYKYEHNHAFFPALPILLRIIQKLLKQIFTNITNSCSTYVFLAIVTNLFFFTIATIGIYLFPLIYFQNVERREGEQDGNLKKVKEKPDDNSLHNTLHSTLNKDNCYYLYHIDSWEECKRFSFFLSLLYIFSVGNIHTISFYNESIFSCFSIWGFNFLKLSLNNYKFNFIFEILAVMFFFIASCFRSNGILFLIPLFFYNLYSCKFVKHCIKSWIVNVEDCHNNKELVCGENKIFSYFCTQRRIICFLIFWLKALCEALIIIFPLLIFQFYSYHLYCIEHDDLWINQNKQFYFFLINFFKNPISYFNIGSYNNIQKINRPWCEKVIPFSYSYIQKKYWNVKFLKFLFDLDFKIFYSAPIYFTSYHSIIQFFKNNKFYLLKTLVLYNPFFMAIAHLFFLTTYIFLFAHNEIILRLILGCPVFYLHYAYLLKYSKKWNFLLFINLLYFFVGPPLFGTFIAWT
ncbi:GPI mannosyltransferase 2, putative [Plasmodium vinckei lentum]|uniref:GPI mannosyltransferase 2 n=1 Tax=Plasmodium vinckei lentum TaxID=138297 RepID=A0A6V7T265_PLAVN|nr:GPI mannosyltransferase 2, putative [Plasmodium vinckei lentum]